MLAFCAAIVGLLTLPIALELIGLPSREQAWTNVPTNGGAIGDVVRTLYHDRQNADVLFLGSSLVRRGVDLNAVQASLSSYLGRPAVVECLCLNWPGADLQYFMLRDYMARHRPTLIVWNPAGPSTSWSEAHNQAYRWLRFGEYADQFSGLSWPFRVQLYGEMVLGAPRELLDELRPNLLYPSELSDREGEGRQYMRSGYEGGPFTDEPPVTPAPVARVYLGGDPTLRSVGPTPNAFELKYIRGIVALSKAGGARLILIHVPTDLEYGDQTIPEVANWDKLLEDGAVGAIGIPAARLFDGFTRAHFLKYYSDHHLNANGRRLFTDAITPSLESALNDNR
jgi:hypothetical protein